MKNIFLIIVLIFVVSCSFSQGKFTVLSNRPIDVTNFTVPKDELVKVTGKDMLYIIGIHNFANGTYMGMGGSTYNPQIDNAIDNAFLKTNGNLLVNTSIKYTYFFVPPFYFSGGWKVEGEAIKK